MTSVKDYEARQNEITSFLAALSKGGQVSGIECLESLLLPPFIAS